MGLTQQIRRMLERPTRERRRAEAMGFKFWGFDAIENPLSFGILATCNFTCVCGRHERAAFAVDYEDLDHLRYVEHQCDMAARLRDHGSFSASHLRKDGYTEEQITDMMAKGEQFDLENPV